MARLLVSVRSAAEASAALAGGAHVLDIKEPSRGPLGRADPEIWRAVHALAPADVPLSVALGELLDWERPEAVPIAPDDFAGIRFRKLGLAGAADRNDWPDRWEALRDFWGDGPSWIAVIYADWERARAPHPEAILEVALTTACAGVLIDTWSKVHPSPLDTGPFWSSLINRVRSHNRLVALAGGLDAPAIARLAPLSPDLFAVRGAACSQGRREAAIDTPRVARLVMAASKGTG